MMTDAIAAARRAARALQRMAELPDALVAIPLDALVADLGVAVDYFAADRMPGTLGFLDPVDDLIWLSDGLADERDQLTAVGRFTLAHELGHWRLHRGTAAAQEDCAPADITESLDDEHAALLRPAEAYSPRSRREREANAFAAELLAPLALVRRAYLGLDGPPRATEAIAAAFHVSRSVIVTQLMRLLTHDDVAERASDAAATMLPTDGAILVLAPLADHAATPTPRRPVPMLDASQRTAVEAPTPVLVVAGPGTGKTSTLVARVQRLVEDGVAPTHILALTFSRKATEELSARIATALGTSDGAMLPTIATFHQFCGDLLRPYGYLVGLRPDYQLIDDIGAFFVLRDLGNRLPLQHYASLTTPTLHFGALLAAIGKAKDELVTPEQYRALAEAMEDEDARARTLEVAEVYALYQAELARRQDADYGDLIRLVVQLFADHPDVAASVRAQYTHLLVDEFQDINRANGILLRHLAGTAGAMWAVGDANQAIYRFRGASPANLAAFGADYPQARIVALDHNYRSRPAIVTAANHFAGAELRSEVALHAVRPASDGAEVRAFVAPDGAGEIAAIAGEIQRRHAEGAAWGDHAVLCRTRATVRLMTAGLSAAGIPAAEQTDLFDDEQIKDVLGVVHLLAGEQGGLLRAARVPEHTLSRAAQQAVLVALRTGASGVSDALTMAQAQSLPERDRAHLARLHQILLTMQRQPTIAHALALYCFDLTADARQHVLADDAAARHLAELLALAGRFDTDRAAGTGDAAHPVRRWRDFLGFLRAVRELPRGQAPTGEAVRDQVHVLTVHGAKGLEWPIVFVPRLIAGAFPSRARYDAAPPPPGLVAGASSDPTRDHLLEEACLFYVAITRARDTLILSRAERNGRTRSNPSPFWRAALGNAVAEERVGKRTATVAADDANADVALAPAPEDPAFAPLDVLTGSALTTYDQCPRQYAYRYGYHFAGGRNPYGRLRRAVNDALRTAAATAGDTDQALTAFDAAWQAGASPTVNDTPDPFDALYQRHGRTAVTHAAPHVRAPDAADAFDRVVEVAVEDTIIRVELDRTEGAATAPQRVVRHHIGRRTAHGERATLNTYLAVLAQRKLSGDAGADTIIEHHLTADQIVPVQLTSKEEAALRTQILAAVRGIRAGEFPARPEDRRCAGCEFALICPV
jgi:DNA helicase-2/ATP-dependent DNA helicase PcrA